MLTIINNSVRECYCCICFRFVSFSCCYSFVHDYSTGISRIICVLCVGTILDSSNSDNKGAYLSVELSQQAQATNV